MAATGRLEAVSPWGRVRGLGSVYAKTLRDSRLAFLIAAGLMGGLMLYLAWGIPSLMGTPQARAEIVRMANEVSGAAQGITGPAVNLGTVGGYIQWKYGPVFLIIAALWSILALSGTLATETQRGSLDFVAAAPFGKRRIALEKVAAHVSVLSATLVIMALVGWLATGTFGTLSGDAVPLEAAFGYALWVWVMALWFGGLAFALAPILGRGAAGGIAGFLLFTGWVLGNYESAMASSGWVANVTPWAWTYDHLPLAGQYDWPTLVPVGIVASVFLVLGVEVFARRDLLATSAVRLPGLPRITIGLGGATGRALGERLPAAMSWGLGIGIFGMLMASISRTMADEVAKSPDLARVLSTAFPTFDVLTAGGFLQLMVQLLLIVVGFAAATLVAGWGSDETSGRLELLLATPLDRRAWVIRSGLGVFLAIAAMTLLMAVLISLGAAGAGSDALTPVIGTGMLGLYAAALAGVGFAVGGWLRTSIAGEAVAAIVIVTYLVDLLSPALQLPDWFHQLALTAHLGQPMVGSWDWPGMAACVIIAVGGLLIGARGFARRDVGR
jgi:ABC-2 type transport system permease protein